MGNASQDYRKLAGDASVFEGAEHLREEQESNPDCSALQLSEALVQSMEDAHWEGLMGCEPRAEESSSGRVII